MKLANWGLAILLVAAAPAAGGVFSEARLGVDASIEPAAGGTYVCLVEVSDLATGELVAAPRVQVRSGDEAKLSMEPEGAGERLQVNVAVDEPKGTALLRIAVVRDGRETVIQQLRLRLR